MVHKVGKKLVLIFQVSSLASSRMHWLAASANSRQRWCAPKVAANSFQNTFLRNTSSPKISVLPQELLDRILRSITAISWPRLTLVTAAAYFYFHLPISSEN